VARLLPAGVPITAVVDGTLFKRSGKKLLVLPRDHLVSGADCEVPYSTDATRAANIEALRHSGVSSATKSDGDAL
jgi:hypothetical protein